MNIAEWIIVGILSTALLIFLILGIIVFAKFKKLAEEATKIAVKGQDAVDAATDVVENVRDFTSVGKIVKKVVGDAITMDNKTSAKKSSKKELKDDK